MKKLLSAESRGQTLGRLRVTDAVEVAGAVRIVFTRFDERWSPTVHWATFDENLEIAASDLQVKIPVESLGLSDDIIYEVWNKPKSETWHLCT